MQLSQSGLNFDMYLSMLGRIILNLTQRGGADRGYTKKGI